MEILRVEHLTKRYGQGEAQVSALDDVSFCVEQGEFVAIMGASGSGKTTLMNILTGLDTASEGKVILDGVDAAQLDEIGRQRFRAEKIGLVFQQFHLIPYLTALENVMMPMLIGRQNKTEAKDRAEKILGAVGLSHRITHRPSALSGGERQRVAIARALVNNPALVLADEPTGNLDHKTTESIFELIQTLNAEQNIAFLLVTHDMSLAQKLSRCLTMQDGILKEGA